jgi:hypothetical protein
MIQRDKVVFTLRGDSSKVQEIVEFLQAGKQLNSWGAQCSRLDEVSASEAASDPERNHYQVNTDNVDEFNWSSNVEFYL